MLEGENDSSNESQIIRTEYSELMKKSYIDYAMSVIIATCTCLMSGMD